MVVTHAIEHDQKTKSMHKTIVLASILLLFMVTQAAKSQNLTRDILSEPPPIFLKAMMGDGHPDAKVVSPGLFAHVSPYFEIYSAIKNQFAGTIDGDLYIRNHNSEAYVSRIKSEQGWYWHIDNAAWSPNGQYVIAKQINDIGVPTIKLTHGSPTDITHKTYSRAGEKIPTSQFYIIEVATGNRIAVKQNKNFPYIHVMDWQANNQSVFLVEADRLMKEIKLRKVDIHTGESTVVISETSETYLIGLDLLQGNSRRLQDLGLLTLLDDREQLIWLSERSGFYQLYLYDYDGNLVRTLTEGVYEHIVDVDLDHDWLYYTAYTDPDKPYSQQVCRTSLTANRIEKLSDKEGVIDAFVSEKKDSLYVLRSGLPALMQMEAYTMDGLHLATTWKGKVTALENDFFKEEYPQVLAADNKTILATLILKPRDFDPNKKYPIVEYIYGGNFTNEVIRDLFSPVLWEMQELANNGCVVVFIDGRGTPKRGQAFRDFSYGKLGQVEIEDHVYALKQLGADRPFMDMNKIGIMGHSWGGHFALRALLEAPNFYKVGHISAPAFDPLDFRVAVEAFMGCLPQDCPEKYEQSNISTKLSNLKAPLMIVHGTADDDVPIDESYKIVANLKAMQYTNYEFIEYQGVDHIVMRHPEWKSRMIDFFVKEFKKI
jgi:dienelactone hydrolase